MSSHDAKRVRIFQAVWRPNHVHQLDHAVFSLQHAQQLNFSVESSCRSRILKDRFNLFDCDELLSWLMEHSRDSTLRSVPKLFN